MADRYPSGQSGQRSTDGVPTAYPVNTYVGHAIRDEGDETEFDFSEFRKVITFKLGGIVGSIGGATAPPSEVDLAQWAEVKADIGPTIDQVNGLVGKLKPFYQKLAAAGLYPAVPKAIEKP